MTIKKMTDEANRNFDVALKAATYFNLGKLRKRARGSTWSLRIKLSATDCRCPPEEIPVGHHVLVLPRIVSQSLTAQPKVASTCYFAWESDDKYFPGFTVVEVKTPSFLAQLDMRQDLDALERSLEPIHGALIDVPGPETLSAVREGALSIISGIKSDSSLIEFLESTEPSSSDQAQQESWKSFELIEERSRFVNTSGFEYEKVRVLVLQARTR